MSSIVVLQRFRGLQGNPGALCSASAYRCQPTAVSLLLLHFGQRRLGLRLGGLHVTGLARSLGLANQLGCRAVGGRLRTRQRARGLVVLTTRSLVVLTTRGLAVLTTRGLAVLTTRGLVVLTTR